MAKSAIDTSAKIQSGDAERAPRAELDQELRADSGLMKSVAELDVTRAERALVKYPDFALKDIASKWDHPGYCKMAHSSLGEVEKTLFLTCAIAMNNIVDQAAALLHERRNKPAKEVLVELRRLRVRAMQQLCEQKEASPEEIAPTYNATLKRADRALIDVLNQLAQPKPDPLLLMVRAADLALMALRSQKSASRLADELQAHLPKVIEHRDLMREAFQRVARPEGRRAYPEAQSVQEAAFLCLCDLKLQRFGYIPPAQFVHDVDGNLVHNEDSTFKPGNIIGRVISELDKIHPIPGWQRLVLGDSLCRIPGYEKLAKQMFQYAGAEGHTPLPDAAAAVDLALDHGVGTTIITANMADYAKGIAQHFKDPDKVAVIGKEPDSFAGQEKAFRLLELVIKHPDAVFLMSDNRDSNLAEAVRKKCIPHLRGGADLPPQELYFFVARQGHDFARVLKSAGVPHALNAVTKTGSGAYVGYQGVKRLTELYTAWRTARLAEGWPASKMEAKSLAEVHRIVKEGASALRDLESGVEQGLQRFGALLTELHSSGKPLPWKELRDAADLACKRDILNGTLPYLNRDLLELARARYEQAIEGKSPAEHPLISAAVLRDLQAAEGAGRHRQDVGGSIALPGKLLHSIVQGHSVAVLNVGGAELNQALLEREDIRRARADHDYLVLRFETRDQADAIVPQSAVLCRDRDARTRIRGLSREYTLKGEAFLLAGEQAPTHQQQYERLVQKLNRERRVAILYYRNGFDTGGGLEQTLREQAKAFDGWGFKVRMVGGNEPARDKYPAKLLRRYEHRTIEGAHERDERAFAIAQAIYRGEVLQPEYDDLYQQLKDALAKELADVDYAVLHNPLFLRNVPFTQALIDLKREGALPNLTLLCWVHDVGVNTEGERFIDSATGQRRYEQKGAPWWYAHMRFPGMYYIGVSEQVREEISEVPCLDPADPMSSAVLPAVNPGVDYSDMQRQNRIINALEHVVDWERIDYLLTTPGRVAERKGTWASINAVALLPRAGLVITSGPKVVHKKGQTIVDDPYYEAARQLVRKLGIEDRVYFLHDFVGEITDKEYNDAFGGLTQYADGALTLPEREGFGIAHRAWLALNPILIATDDGALRGNLQDAARYVPKGCHPAQAALEAAAALAQLGNLKLRHESRTQFRWEAKLRAVRDVFGIGDLREADENR